MTTPEMSTPAKVPAGQAAVLVAVLMTAVFAFQLNASMLSPALATMETELNATAAQIGLTQTAFFTAAALFSLFLPRWADLIGRRRVLVGMMAVMLVGCVLAALAPNVTVLFIARVIQGVAGPTVPMALIMLRVQVPEEGQYALLMAIITSVNGGIAGVDALAGGWLASHLGFRSIFWVMAAFAAAGAIAVRLRTRESTAIETPPMDWAGVLPAVIALAALLTAFNEAGKLAAANWFLVAVLVIVGAMMMAQVTDIPWSRFDIALPAFLTIVVMPYTYSIANGIGVGFIMFTLMAVARGKAREVHWIMWLVSVLFVAYFGIDPIMNAIA